MKIIKTMGEIPHQITFRGHEYKCGSNYANLENARREARHFRESKGDQIVVKKFYLQRHTDWKPVSVYVLYIRKVK